MRKHPQKLAEKYRITSGRMSSTRADGNNGSFAIPSPTRSQGFLYIIASDGGGWDHCSVSLKERSPSWKEMCLVKDLFWKPEETVIQYHPPESKYINRHRYVLHLWKQQGVDIPMPPPTFV